jgi:plastocyanin domain-containing protein
MSILTVNTGIALTGSPYTIQNFWSVATTNSVLGDNIQTATIYVSDSGYSPNNISLKKGIKTRLTLITKDVQSCSRSFTVPGLNINQLLPPSGETTIEFTPEKDGPLAFSFSMGMYTGKFNIIN